MQDPRDEYRRVAAESRILEGLPADVIATVVERMQERSFPQGDRLISQDTDGDCLLMLVRGSATVDVETEGETSYQVATVGVGDVIGEMSLISGEKRSANVRAREPVDALILPASDFHQLCVRHPQLAVILTRLVANRLGGSAGDALGGKVVGGYRIRGCIGRGGMAVVYEAVREADGTRCALKMMSHSLVYDSVASRRFGQEAELLAKLEHDNLCRLFERFSAFGTSFLVVEYCDGPGLDEVLERGVPLDEPVVRALIGQLARALEFVHGHGIIHRDIKPSNAMLTGNGQAKLMDFGIARPTVRTGDTTETQEFTIFGTPRYMAPEQFSGRNLDSRADNYALACVAYELLTGAPLFDARDFYGIVQQKSGFRIPPPETIGPGISAEMHAFLESNLRPDPEDRPATLEAQTRWAESIDPARLGG